MAVRGAAVSTLVSSRVPASVSFMYVACRDVVAALLCLVLGAAGSALAEDGKALLERNCGRCHAISEAATSSLSGAPNLWTALRSYPDEQLEFELSEGIGSRHSKMPQIQFSSEEISSIQDFLFNRTQRAR
jgi:mono/diheme cytochrome c family protein